MCVLAKMLCYPFLVMADVNLGDYSSKYVTNYHVFTEENAKSGGCVWWEYEHEYSYINSVCKSLNFHLRNIGSIRHVLTQSSTTQLVHAPITSRLNYCNLLLMGLPGCQLQRLQCTPNHAACVVSQIGKYDHITPTLHSLHWCPVKQRI